LSTNIKVDLMKTGTLALCVFFISIICVLNLGFVFALDSDGISITPSWTTATPSQGQTTSVKLYLTSKSSEQIVIYYIGINFDWMPSDSFIGLDLSDDPVVIAPSGIHIFDAMAIQIPENVSVGSHSYFIGIDGVEGSASSFSWNSPSFTLQILDVRAQIYYMLKTQVDTNLTRAVNAAYQSAEAQSLLDQAKSKYADSETAASAGNWEEAVSALEQAAINLERAETAEQQFAEQSAGWQSLILILIPFFVIIIVIVVVLIVRKRRKQPEHTNDQTLENQDFMPE
jgi:hypothetical protein